MSLNEKAQVIWDLAQNIDTIQSDGEIAGSEQQAYNLCLVTQNLCLRLIAELDDYKVDKLKMEPHDFLREKANYQEVPRVYVRDYVNDYGDEAEGALLKEQDKEE